MYSYYSYYGCYRVAGTAIKVTSGTAIRTTYSTAVKIASRIGGAASKINRAFYGASCGASYRRYCGHY